MLPEIKKISRCLPFKNNPYITSVLIFHPQNLHPMPTSKKQFLQQTGFAIAGSMLPFTKLFATATPLKI